MKSLSVALCLAASFAALTACTTTQPEQKKDALAAPPPPKEASPKENFDQAISAFDQGKLDEAKALFLKVAQQVPTNLVVQYDVAVISERQGNLVDAVKYYEAAHKLDPRHKPTLLNLGRAYRAQDKFAQAIALYEEAIKEPGNEFDVELNNNLTVTYRLAKKFDQAEATARKVLSRTKDNADAYKNLALIYFDQGNYRLAEFISANAKKLDDKDPGVYNNLGLIYLKMDDRRLALGQFQKAVALNQDFAPGLFNIGAMALSYRDYDGAEKVLARATRLDPTSYEGLLAYGWALDGQKGKDPKKGVVAGQAFEKVLAIKAEQGDAICGAAWAYAADKTGWDKALTFFDRCKGLPNTSAQDQQVIDTKVKGILAMQKSGQATEATQEKAKAVAPTKQGADLLDKVSAEAAAKDQASPEQPAGDAAAKPADAKQGDKPAEAPKADPPPKQ